MQIDWAHMLWQGRWDALVILWDALVIDVQTNWWFGPLLALFVIALGRKGILRLASQIARVFVQTHGPN